jgi:hypothetical protein
MESFKEFIARERANTFSDSETVTLSFKVSREFRQAFKIESSIRGLTMHDLLLDSCEAILNEMLEETA